MPEELIFDDSAMGPQGAGVGVKLNKFSMARALWLADGTGKPRNRRSPGTDYHRIRFSMRLSSISWKIPPFLQVVMKLPHRRKTTARHASFSNKLLHFSFRDLLRDRTPDDTEVCCNFKYVFYFEASESLKEDFCLKPVQYSATYPYAYDHTNLKNPMSKERNQSK